jgi:uncharacterized protein (UPF0276 family)
MSSEFLQNKNTLPQLGIGLGLRRELAEETFNSGNLLGFLEIIPDQYMGKGGNVKERLARACALFPLVSHSLNLSLGSADPLDWHYIEELKNFIAEIEAPWFSDHICFSSLGQTYFHELLPIPFSRATVKHMTTRIRQVQNFIERPFLLENTTYYMKVPGSHMSEQEFISELLETTDCGLLLDLNNVFVNSCNHNFDPYEFLEQIPLERTVQIHMAGHAVRPNMVLDTHGAPIAEPVYDLLKYVLQKTRVCGITIERDQNMPPFEELAQEITTIKNICEKAQA